MICFVRNRYGLPVRSIATTADALYTMTMLRLTSRSVAMNRTRSDLSLRAIKPRFDPPKTPTTERGCGRRAGGR